MSDEQKQPEPRPGLPPNEGATACECPPRKELVKEMVDRFLAWRLPDSFSPDGGISFKPHRDAQIWPVGTNLLDADQAEAMFRHVLVNLPCPCEGMRLELNRDRDRRASGSLAWKLANREAERDALQAECDSLRAKLANLEEQVRELTAGEVSAAEYCCGEVKERLCAELAAAKAERDSLRVELEQERKADIDVQQIVGALESDLAASQERERAMREALAALVAEVKGLLGVAPIAILDAVGNTNVACIQRRAEQADAVLKGES